uniref:A-kinase anchor protein 14-like n=1 Tax=Ciona intestinalis TaxID=7719 RepID=F6Q290_CIOIN|nr:A-kinase anchor protein 14-like [Ciona intestinalis]|eukprot:XP_002129712.1 A-kinase anchor protein 14-like [Ciona intestinalis]
MNFNFEEEANELVRQAIESAIKQVVFEQRHDLSNISANYNDNETPKTDNITWVSCQKFNQDEGVENIEKFVATWKRDSAWLYCIDFLNEEEHDYDRRFNFRVRWSIPTRRKPIPRATASVYFTIKVSKIKPQSLPVEVYYVFEGSRLVHRPGNSRFREVWLKNVVSSKIEAMEQVTF